MAHASPGHTAHCAGAEVARAFTSALFLLAWRYGHALASQSGQITLAMDAKLAHGCASATPAGNFSDGARPR